MHLSKSFNSLNEIPKLKVETDGVKEDVAFNSLNEIHITITAASYGVVEGNFQFS